MIDNLIYKELQDENDFIQCIELQRSIFKMPDIHLISPLLIELIARKIPPIGITLGVFKDKELIGFTIGFATFIEKSIYIAMIGFKEEYQNKGYGFRLGLKLRELSIQNNLQYIFAAFNPFEENLARLYFFGLGFIGIKYEMPAENSGTDDKIIIKWDILSENTKDRINRTSNRKKAEILSYPLVTSDTLSDSLRILMEIPSGFNKNQSKEETIKCRTRLRSLLNEYINKRNYIITDCISNNINNKRISYYLLEKL